MNRKSQIVEEGFAREVREGLEAEQKQLPSKFLYDELGSILFEAICVLPEYYLTRTERQILVEHAGDIAKRVRPEALLVELGAGSAVKTSILIEELSRRNPRLVYCPIDISKEALRSAQANIVSRFPSIVFRGIEDDWFKALGQLTQMEQSQKLVVFLGSSIGNMSFDGALAFLARLHATMGAQDKILLGTDMVKPVDQMLPAYDDQAGVTAAFNRNVLVRLNHALDGDFDPRVFRHEARWNPEEHRVEMHLVAQKAHEVRLEGIGLSVRFGEGESIHTENSHKFTPQKIDALVEQAGMVIEQVWHDDEDRFRLNLIAKAA